MAQEGEQTRWQASLASWKKGHQEITDAAKKIEAQRAELAARVILQDRTIADQRRKNDELFKIGSEVLSKYEGFGLGTAIAAREPFTRNMRVKLETLDSGLRRQARGQQDQPRSQNRFSKEQAAAKVEKPAPATQR
jgi:hypothetical protein